MTVDPIGRRKTTWPSALPLQQAADSLRDRSYYESTGEPDTELAHDVALADLLDETANAMSWLAPFRSHEGGYGMWEAAARLAAILNGASGSDDPNEGDELVYCGSHCPARVWFRHAEERGWVPGHMGTWTCPTHAAVPGSAGGDR